MHFPSNLPAALFLLSFVASTISSAVPENHHIRICPPHGPHRVQVRLPPSLGSSKKPWVPVPPGWDLGNWFQTFSSAVEGSANIVTRNLQAQTELIDPSVFGTRTDLSSFQLLNNATIITSYGLDTPVAGFFDVYNYTGTGLLEKATDLLEILAWGCDTAGVPYRLSFSTFTPFTRTPATVDILSRTDKGPTLKTVQKLKHALIALGNPQISALAQAIGKALQDGARAGLPPVTCDAACQTNEDLAGLF